MNQHGELNVVIETVAEEVNPATFHGWNTGRLLKFQDHLYFIANKVRPPDADEDDWLCEHGLVFRRKATGNDKWQQVAEIHPRYYTGCVDHLGRLWMVSPKHFNSITLWRSGPNMDFKEIDRLYDGTCTYLGMGTDGENHLLMHAEDTNHLIRFPNAMIGVFYDKATDSWHPHRLVTPEGRYGYVGIVLKGRKVIALMQSTLFDKTAEPNWPYYNWRFLKVVKCNDLTKDKWVQKPLLMCAFGQTKMYDMMKGPNGNIYLAYQHRGGDDSYEATQARPTVLYITRVKDDLSMTTFEPGVEASAVQLLVNRRQQWFMVGRKDKLLHLWRLDAGQGFKAVDDWILPGSEVLESRLHTLRPERFGGEDDGDIIHIAGAYPAQSGPCEPAPNMHIRHLRFELPQ